MRTRKIRRYLISFIFSLLSPIAFAVDGVIEINHACAVGSGCFSGDTDAGYPVLIDGSAGKSYRLTSDLVVPNLISSAIFISASGISVDLNGVNDEPNNFRLGTLLMWLGLV